MRVLELMNWRYATKAMNGQKVDDEKINRILESIRLSPSSIGLQPYELIIVTNPELKKELRTAGNNQSQIEDCSHLVIYAVWDQYTPERINAWFDLVNEVRGVKSEGWERMRTGIVSSWPNRPQEQNFNHACMQAYIALGVGLIAAADEGVDATPMEGFNPSEVDRILGLNEKGLRSVLLMPLGYRDEEKDYLSMAKKVRRKMEAFVSQF